MRRQNSNIIVDFISDKGLDKTSRTYFAFVPLENMACYAMAQSCDDDADLDSAKMAVDSVIDAFERKPSFKKIRQYIQYAHDQIVANSVKNKLEAAITVVVTDYTRIRHATCGNVKFFLLSDNAIAQRNKTQTYYDYSIREHGKNVADKTHIKENKNLLQYLGMPGRPRVLASKKILIPEESTMLMATCGFWERVDDIEVLDTYEESKPEQLIETLNEQILLTQLIDPHIRSYSIASLYAEKTFKEDTMKQRRRRRRIIIFSVILTVLAIIAVIVILIIRAGDRRVLNDIERLNSAGLRYMNLGNFAMAHEQYDQANELVVGLRNNWQFRREKRELTDEVLDNLHLAERIVRGDGYLEEGSFQNARQAFHEAFNLAETHPHINAPAVGLISRRQWRADMLMTAEDLAHIAEMYMLENMYHESLARLLEAEDIAREIGDLPLRRDMMARVFEVNRIIGALIEADFIQHVQTLMRRAENDLNFELALQYSEFVINIFDDLGITNQPALDDRDRILNSIRLMAVAVDYNNRAIAATAAENFDDAIRYYEMILVIYGQIGMSVGHNRYRDVVDEILRLENLIRELEDEAAAAAAQAEEDAELNLAAIAEEYIQRALQAIEEGRLQDALRYCELTMVVYRALGMNVGDESYREMLDKIFMLERLIQEAGEEDDEEGYPEDTEESQDAGYRAMR